MQLKELALKSALSLLSPHTKLLHYCYEDEKDRTTIPAYENFCYMLALCHSGSFENALLARTLLRKWVHFEVKGSFPTYLHEYPEVKDKALGCRLLPILRQMRSKFPEDCSALIERIEANLPKDLPPRLSCLFDKDLKWQPKSPQEWVDYLIAYQSFDKTEFLDFTALWDPYFAVYLGDMGQLWQQRGYEPTASMFDLFMGQLHGSFSKRALENPILCVRSALIKPFHQEVLPSRERSFLLHHGGLFWGSKERIHSCVPLHSGFAFNDNHFTYVLEDRETPLDDEPEEFSFFISRHPDMKVSVKGEKATIFRLGEEVLFESPHFSFGIIFESIEGEGEFIGFIRAANRPHQICPEKRFNAYDWEVGLRTLRRPLKGESCKVGATITVLSSQTPDCQGSLPLHGSHCLHKE